MEGIIYFRTRERLLQHEHQSLFEIAKAEREPGFDLIPEAAAFQRQVQRRHIHGLLPCA